LIAAYRLKTSSVRILSQCRLIVLIAIAFAGGCTHKPILVITVGGLGWSQMATVRHAIEKECPQADVMSAGAIDAFKTDVPQMIRENPHDHLVLVGHSLGCQTITLAAGRVRKVDVLVLIEPAPDDLRPPKNVDVVLWYQRTDFDLFIHMAKVFGLNPIKIRGGHNDVPQSKEVVAAVVTAINRIDTRERKK